MANSEVTRRGFLHQVGVGATAAAAVTAVSAQPSRAAEAGAKIKIVGVSTSLRKGKTTAAAVQRVLEAAKAVAPERIEIELIELAGLKMPVEILVGGTLVPSFGTRATTSARMKSASKPPITSAAASAKWRCGWPAEQLDAEIARKSAFGYREKKRQSPEGRQELSSTHLPPLRG